MNNYQGDLLFELCKSFILVADDALSSKEIDLNTYTELTQLKHIFIKDYETERPVNKT